MSKGDDSRPMDISREQFEANRERIWPATPKHCPVCGYLPSWCVCTNDGPGQEEAGPSLQAIADVFDKQISEQLAVPPFEEPLASTATEVVARMYERRRFKREGV